MFPRLQIHDKFRNDANECCIYVCSWLCLRRDIPKISEIVGTVGPSDDGARQDIRVWVIAVEPVDVALSATNMLRAHTDGRYGGASVMKLDRWIPPKPRHV